MGVLSGLFARRGIRFVRAYSEITAMPETGQPEVRTYKVYRARTARQAREYLNGRTVRGPQHIVIETPEGTWGKNLRGLYKE